MNLLTQVELQQFHQRMKESGCKTYVERRDPGMVDCSVHSCHTVCQMVLDKTVKKKLIRSNLAVSYLFPSLKGKERKILFQEEIQRLLI